MDIRSLDLDELTEFIEGLGEKKFRAKQIYRWLHVSLVSSYEEMRNIPKSLQEKLSEVAPLYSLKIYDLQVSKLDGTRKYLFELEDGNMIEAVLMKYKHGNSVCISSEVGCRMGCTFCASAIGGLIRQLSTGEMLDEIYRIQSEIGERVSNIVIMGTGEPLDNYDNVVKFLHMVSDENGLNISQRNITLSTSGIVEGIYELAKENLSITLALSLHATTQERRARLMPIAGQYDILDAVGAMRDYANSTGRRVTFEYSLIHGENDTDEDARRLADLVSGIMCHINLIPVNPVRERNFERPNHEAVLAFQKKLENYGINVTIRRELGRDIDGACGQLRRRHLKGH
ncbi:MAG: 23S rRNA (adenine(2503)-C(2))-methyltransferase RlmN [Lachnospiraceae bacterium]|nr:23S rRNA (adenine(2503)-C(2))-methyltransferase RlmN [Lachnospiraceae bacterium]